MDTMEKQRLYYNQLRKRYSQVSKRIRENQAEDEEVEELSALSMIKGKKSKEDSKEEKVREFKLVQWETISSEKTEDEKKEEEKAKNNRESLEDKLTKIIAEKEQEPSSEKNLEGSSEADEIVTIGMLKEKRMKELQKVLETRLNAPDSLQKNEKESFKEIFERKMQEPQSQENDDVNFSIDTPAIETHYADKKSPFFLRMREKTHTFFHSTREKILETTSQIKEKITKRKRLSTRLKAAAAALFILITGVGIHSSNSTEKETDSASIVMNQMVDYQKESNIESLLQVTIEEPDLVKDIESFEKEDSNQYEDLEDDTKLLLGKSITLNENKKVYMTEYDAYFEENALSSYYSSQDERVIIGALISNGDSMMRICADEENANSLIQDMLDNGGEVVSILTANKNYVLSDYDGSKKLSSEEINQSAEGWYNINDIKKENAKVLCK